MSEAWAERNLARPLRMLVDDSCAVTSLLAPESTTAEYLEYDDCFGDYDGPSTGGAL